MRNDDDEAINMAAAIRRRLRLQLLLAVSSSYFRSTLNLIKHGRIVCTVLDYDLGMVPVKSLVLPIRWSSTFFQFFRH
jgi:hypothetical protein